jgi:putative membrane protein insertion efficiency factor
MTPSAPAQVLALGLIRLYRTFLSAHLPAACRYRPSCSAYAEEAIRTHGFLRGSRLAWRRLLSCRPFGGGGEDPVPPAPAPPGDAPRARGVRPTPASRPRS